MTDKPNAYGTLSVLVTVKPNRNKGLTKNRLNFFNNLYINLSGGKGWADNTFFNGEPAVNGTAVQLKGTGTGGSSPFNWKDLVPTATGAPNRTLYTSKKKLKPAIQSWLSSNNIGAGQGQLPAAGFSSLWFTGGRINFGTSAAAAATGADTPKNLQSGQDAYFYAEPFIGTMAGNSNSNNFVDFSYIDAFDGSVDLIPWFYNTTSQKLYTSTNQQGGLAPVYSVKPGKDSSFTGSSIAAARTWLQANIGPTNVSNGSAVFNFKSSYKNAIQYTRINQPEYVKQASDLVWETRNELNSKIYYHNFAQYLYTLQETYLSAMAGSWGFNPDLPWLTTSTNNGPGYGQQIFNVVFNGFEEGNNSSTNYSAGATIDVYCAPSSQIQAWLTGTAVQNQNATKITLYWDNSSANPGVNPLSDPGNGIYGANPGFTYTTYNSNGEAGESGTVKSLGTSDARTWIVGDFLAALNYGMPLGRFPENYLATDPNTGLTTNYGAGMLIPPQLWLTETSGVIGDNMFSKNGWGFAKVQPNNPNFYNQYAYGISQIAADDYGWAYTDRMQQSVGVNPNPFTFNIPPATTLNTDQASPYQAQPGQEFSTTEGTAASATYRNRLYFSANTLSTLQSYLQSQPPGSYYTVSLPGYPDGGGALPANTSVSLSDIKVSEGYVELSQDIDGGIGVDQPIFFSSSAGDPPINNKVYFSNSELDTISGLFSSSVTSLVVSEGDLFSANTQIEPDDIIQGGTASNPDMGYIIVDQPYTAGISNDAPIDFTPNGSFANDPLVFLELSIRPPAKAAQKQQAKSLKRLALQPDLSRGDDHRDGRRELNALLAADAYGLG